MLYWKWFSTMIELIVGLRLGIKVQIMLDPGLDLNSWPSAAREQLSPLHGCVVIADGNALLIELCWMVKDNILIVVLSQSLWLKRKKKLPTLWSHGLYLFSPTQETGCDVTVIKLSWDTDNLEPFGEKLWMGKSDNKQQAPHSKHSYNSS